MEHDGQQPPRSGAEEICVDGTEYPFPASEIRRLELRKWILPYVVKGAVGAEIGVFRGHFSEILAEALKPRVLYLVDPWTKLGETFGWGGDYTASGKLTTRYALLDAQRRMKRFTSCDVRFVEDYSRNFLRDLPEKLDWVYLDSSHNYKDTIEELDLIDKALKHDGVIFGDDWHPDPNAQHHGVFQAVHEVLRGGAWEIVAAGPGGQWIIRRKLDHAYRITYPGRTDPRIAYLMVDVAPARILKGAKTTIGGVVALSAPTTADGYALTIAGPDLPRPIDVTWGIDSPRVGPRYPDSPNSARARFTVDFVAPQSRPPLWLQLAPRDGGAPLTLAVLTPM